ncbi:phosphoglycolate phosphatase [Methylotenera versatilis]|uniref:phosphoglycolate phosphatase n=1 Tax=Methylotenera versatilis TaxID=1055487 RepID=UPI0009DFB2D8|nr:phosphoglycolate phosphatase [Methylotenera versatilis]
MQKTADKQFKVKLVMFDLDGTLIDTAPQIAEAMNLALTDLGLNKLPISRITDYIGAGVDALIKRCLTDNLHDESDATLLEQAQAAFFVHYANNVTKSLPYHGVISGLRAVKSKDFKMACVTNKPERFTLPLLQASGLIDFFELVVSGDSLPKKKPDPMQLQYICAKLGVLTTNALLVGDSNTDIAAARAAGCPIVTMSYGYNQGIPIEVTMVDAIIDDLSGLTKILMN